jgi:hypothetical protein
VCVRRIARSRIAGGERHRGQLPPAIGKVFVQPDCAPERGHRLDATTACRIRAAELELHERRVAVCARKRLQSRRRRRGVAELAARRRKQQIRLRVPGRVHEDTARPLRGCQRIRVEQ